MPQLYSQKTSDFFISRAKMTKEFISLLADTEFDTQKQIDRYLQTVSGSLPESKAIALSQILSDIQAFYFEHLSREPVLFYPQILKVDDKVVIPNYGGIEMNKWVSKNEREGAVFEGVKNLERILLEKNSGIVVHISPRGWSGYENDHPETQIGIFNIDNNTVQGMTVRSSLFDGLTKDQIKALVLNPFIVDNIEDFFQNILLDNEFVWYDSVSSKVWILADIFERLDNSKILTPIEIQQILQNFEKKYWDQNLSIDELGELIESTILQIAISMNIYSKYGSLSSLSGCNPSRKLDKNRGLNLLVLGYRRNLYCRHCGLMKNWVGPCGICTDCEA